MHRAAQELEEYIDYIGALEGAPDQIIDQAKNYGRTLLFHVKPSRRASPADAQAKAAAYLRRRTCQIER